MRTKRLFFGVILVICLLGFFPVKVNGMIRHMDFDEVAYTADIIFTGTVTDKSCRMNRNGKMIFTDVTFGDLEVIYVKPGVKQQINETLVLTYAGGKVNNVIIDISDMPKLTVGQRYMIFSLFDGKNYLNPIIGGDLGIFSLIKDDDTGIEYPIGSNKSGIVSVQNGKLKRAPGIRRVANGIPIEAMKAFPMTSPPRPAKGSAKGMEHSARSRLRTPPGKILSKYEFIFETLNVLSEPRPVKEVLRGNSGKSVRPGKQKNISKVHDNKPSTKSRTGKVPVSTILSTIARQQDTGEVNITGTSFLKASSGDEGQVAVSAPPLVGDELCWCGSYDLPLVMEQVPESWWTWGDNNDSMVMYNNYMNIYRYTDDDGRYGRWNGENEFCGFLSDGQLYDHYDTHWGTAIAMACSVRYWTGCAEIREVDIMFKADVVWHETLDELLDAQSGCLYLPVAMHELGHSWGMQAADCGETYEYNMLSVMHRAYINVIEDGRGIHMSDAYALRQNYRDQRSIKNIKDIGVESYYASSGLVNSTTNTGSYGPGSPITVYNVTLENMSNTSVNDVRVRLYLSEDNIITDSDHLITYGVGNSYWQWASFALDGFWVGDFDAKIPSVPTGWYYVGIIATIDGNAYNLDDMPLNNATYLSDKIHVTCTSPSLLTNLTASSGTYSDKILLSFNIPSGGISHIEIWRGLTPNSNESTLIEPSWTSTGYADTNVEAGTTYYYWLKAVNSCGNTSGYSASASGWRAGVCPTPPNYTYTIVPSGDWKVTDTHNAGDGSGCNVYRMYLYAGRSYDFSVCGGDGVGGETFWGDTDFAMYNSSGTMLWSLDNGQKCNISASTLGTPRQAWAPSSTGYYYLKIFEQSGNNSASYRLAYKQICNTPAAPTGVSATDGVLCDMVYISWNSVPLANEYQVWRDGMVLSSWQSETFYEDYTANQYGVPHTYEVIASNYCGFGEAGSDTGFRRFVPYSPANVQATDGEYCDRIRVTWNDVVYTDDFDLYRDGVFLATIHQVNFYNDYSVVRGQSYTYQVKAANACGTSGMNAGDSGFATAVSAMPDIQATDGSLDNYVTVSWADPVAREYQVYRNGVAVTDWQTDSFYKDSTSKACTGYRYQVHARDDCGHISISNQDYGFWGGSASASNPNPAVGDQVVSVNTSFSWSDNTTDYLMLDDFDRPDSTDMGPDWTESPEVLGSFSISGDRAVCDDLISTMIYNGVSFNHIGVDVTNDGSGYLKRAALILGHADADNNVYVMLQGGSTFDKVYFYFGFGGFSNYLWPNSGIQTLSTPFTDARMTARLVGDTVTVEFDTDFDGVADQSYSRGGLPTQLLGTGNGLAGYNANLDNFGYVPVQAQIPDKEYYVGLKDRNSGEPAGSSDIGGERSVAVYADRDVRVSALLIDAKISKETDLTLTIRSLSGIDRKDVLASKTVHIRPEGVPEVPIDFTFHAGRRYDIGFNVKGDWGREGYEMAFYPSLNNPELDQGLGFRTDLFWVLSGGKWDAEGKGYKNSDLPYIQVKVLESYQRPVYDLYLDSHNPPTTLVAEDLTSAEFNLQNGLLEDFTTYYWQVVSRNFCCETASPIWVFETELIADFNGDNIVDLADYSYLAENWLKGDCLNSNWCDKTDMDFNGNVQSGDLSVYADNWLNVGIRYKDLTAVDIAAMDSEMTSDPIDGSDGRDFGVNTFFIYVTNTGKYGKFIVEDLDKSQNNQLTLSWVTYNADGSIYSASEGLVIRGNYSCDLDEGSETTIGSDWLWQIDSSTGRFLYPSNTARFMLVRQYN